MRRSRRPLAKVTQVHQDSDEEKDEEDFVDSGSEASIPDEDTDDSDVSSAEEFTKVFKSKPTPKNKITPSHKRDKPVVLKKNIFHRINIPVTMPDIIPEIKFNINDLTEDQKKLPEFLNLSESDTDDDCENDPKMEIKHDVSSSSQDLSSIKSENIIPIPEIDCKNVVKLKNENESIGQLSGSDTDSEMEDVLPNQTAINEASSDVLTPDIYKKMDFQHLHENSKKLDEAKQTLEMYNKRYSASNENTIDVKALLAMGESEDVEMLNEKDPNMSDSDIEDLEEVQVAGESKSQVVAPKGAIQVTLDLPAGNSKQKKKLDLLMMMKRRINRVKKEVQVDMHKVHVLSWIGHGNFINKTINDELIMARALSLIPSEHCYPDNRVNIKYLEQIVKWYSEEIDLKEDKSDLKYKSNKLPLKTYLLNQITKKVVSSKKNKVLIFVAMLRALGIACRVVLSFQLVPMHPPTTELLSLSTKDKKEEENASKHSKASTSKGKTQNKSNKQANPKLSDKIAQLDGADDDLVDKTQRKSTRKSSNIKNKGSSASSNLEENKIKDKSSTSTVSYWDTITQGVIDPVPEERVSHKDLIKSRSTRKNTNEMKSAEKTAKSVSLENKKKDKSLVTKSTNKKDANKSKVVTKKESTSLAEEDENDVEFSKKPSRNSRTSRSEKNDKTSKSKKSINKQDDTKINIFSSKKLRSDRSKNPESSKYFENNEPSIKKTSKKAIKNNAASPNTSKIGKDSSNARVSRERKQNPIIKNKLILPDVNTLHKKRRPSNASDADFKPSKRKSTVKNNVIDRRVLSSDDEIVNDKKKRGVNIWCEVYVEEEEQWISADVLKGEVHCAHQLYTRSNHPVTYVVTWDTLGHIKDVTRRYVPHWNTVTRRLRVNPEWFSAAIKPWKAPENLRDRREDQELDRLQLDAPMPQTIFEFKNHPLYALKRHLLKFEVLYPPDSMVLGFVKNEPVYARECIHVCRSRETWVKEAKVVRAGEQPYKIVKARPKYDKSSGQMICDLPLEVFGPWQVDDYVPPIAEGGMVPRNPYGNVELFKPTMLPGGTVHLVLPGLNKVARKLKIDCAPAMVGFDYHSGGSHPLYDGFVVCEEFKDQLVAAWEEEQIEAEKRAREKIEKRVYGNWRKLIRGLFIRRKLQNKYDFQTLIHESEPSNSASNKRSKYFDQPNKKRKVSDKDSGSD